MAHVPSMEIWPKVRTTIGSLVCLTHSLKYVQDHPFWYNILILFVCLGPFCGFPFSCQPWNCLLMMMLAHPLALCQTSSQWLIKFFLRKLSRHQRQLGSALGIWRLSYFQSALTYIVFFNYLLLGHKPTVLNLGGPLVPLSCHTRLSAEKSWKCCAKLCIHHFRANAPRVKNMEDFWRGMISTIWNCHDVNILRLVGSKWGLGTTEWNIPKMKIEMLCFSVAGHPLANGEAQPSWDKPVCDGDSFEAGGPTWWAANCLIRQGVLLLFRIFLEVNAKLGCLLGLV